MFALDRVGELAPEHPEWKDKEPFKAVLTGDRAAMAKFSEGDWAEIIAATHAGMSNEQFAILVGDWLAKAKHAKLQAAVHRAGLPADARGHGLPARQRLSDLHRDRRRPGVRARLQRAGLRRPGRAGGGLEHRHQVRIPGRQAGADARAQGVLHRRSAPASRSASICSSASGPMPRSATRAAIARCWNGPAPARARG